MYMDRVAINMNNQRVIAVAMILAANTFHGTIEGPDPLVNSEESQ